MDSIRLILLVLSLVGAVAFISKGIRMIKREKNEALTLLMAGILCLTWAMLRIIYYKFPGLIDKNKIAYLYHLGSMVSGALLVLLIIIVLQGIKNRQR
jgi:hypothetical protein